MTHDTRYDMLEVMFHHAPGAAQALTLGCLQEALEPYFEVEPLELAPAAQTSHQVLRIASALGESFTSAAAFDRHLRELAGDGFEWHRIGAVRAGQFATVRG